MVHHPSGRSIATSALVALLFYGSSARAADILGIEFGDSPGVAAAKLTEYAQTIYGDTDIETTSPGRLARARAMVREGGDTPDLDLARHLVEISTIEMSQEANADGRPAVQYIAANILPSHQAGSVDHERITVVFSGLASGNVAFKIQRYVVFKPADFWGMPRSAPVGVPGLSSGVGADAVRNSIVAKLGKPAMETDAKLPYHEEPQSGGFKVGGDTKTLAFRLDGAGAGPADGSIDLNTLGHCVDIAESADLSPGGAALTGGACPALLVLRMYSGRGPLVNRMDEFLVNFPALKSLSDADEAAARRAEAAIGAIQAAGLAARRDAIAAQLAAALHDPAQLHF